MSTDRPIHGSGNLKRILRAGWPDTWEGCLTRLLVWFRAPEPGNLRPILRAGWPDTWKECQEASRYGLVLRNQTNLNGPRISESTDRESEANPESRVAGHLGRMPSAEASAFSWFRPRIGESEANPESRVAGHLERMPLRRPLGMVSCSAIRQT